MNQQISSSRLPTSDPIASFSSPMPIPVKRDESHFHSIRRQKAPTVHRSPSPAHHDSGEDSDLPDTGQVLTADIRGDTKRKNLLEMKRRALDQQKRSTVHDDDDDDDLEIIQSPKVVVKEEESHRRALHKRPSEGRKRQMHLAQINPTKQAAKLESPVRKKDRPESSLSVLHHGGPVDSKRLNQILAAEVQKNARQEMERKATEWQKYGGRTGGNPEGKTKPGLTSVVQTLAEKGLKAAENSSTGQADMGIDEDEDEGDEDWDPALRGSASPEPVEENEEDDQEQEEEEGDENLAPYAETNMADDFETLDDEGLHIRPTRRMVVNSDSEEEENKENDNELMYDHSEDKENTAVVRHEPLGVAPRSLFSRDDVASPPISPTTQPRVWAPRSQATDDDLTPNRRRPLKELVSDESPTSTQILSTNLTQSFTAKLQQASPLPSTLAPALTLNPLFSGGSSSGGLGGGFSQFSQADGDVFGPSPSLQPGFSDPFESATEKQNSSTGKSEEVCNFPIWVPTFIFTPVLQNLSNKKDLKKVHQTDILDLTQDFNAVNQLQPAFQAGDNFLRKADAIFEKEQEFVVEDAHRKDHKQKKPQLYVNDHGLVFNDFNDRHIPILLYFFQIPHSDKACRRHS